MKIKDSIIILGPGKTGTTLFNDILALHPDLFWISTYVNKYPRWIVLSVLNRLQSLRIFERQTRNKKKFPRTAESFTFWSYYISEFYRTPKAFDPEEILKAQKAVQRIGKYQSGNRFILKLTGPSRFAFLDQIFEDPHIVWIDRDPRSVITSFYKYKWKYKHKPEDFQRKPKKELIKEYIDYYKWLDAEKEKLRQFKFKKVFYEDLVEDPEQFFQNICSFTGLDYNLKFDQIVKSWDIKKNTNEQYKKFFNEEELEYLDSLLSS